MTGLEFVLAALGTAQFILIVITVLSLFSMCKGKPSRIYKRMLQSTQPELVQQVKEAHRPCDVRFTVGMGLLLLSECFNLAYLTILSFNLS